MGGTSFSTGSHFWAVRIDQLGTRRKEEHRSYEIDNAKERGILHEFFPGNVTVGISWDISFDTAKTPGFNGQSVGYDGVYLIRDGKSTSPAEQQVPTSKQKHPEAMSHFSVGDVIGVLLDMELKQLTIYLNGAQVIHLSVPDNATGISPVVGLKGNGDVVTVVPSAPMTPV